MTDTDLTPEAVDTSSGKRSAPEDVLGRGQAALDDPEPERVTAARPVGEVDREP